jgi:SAM-dependent methyltransferase
MSPPEPKPVFDQYASDYDRALQRGLSVSGEDKWYFARGRVDLLHQYTRKILSGPLECIMDFGCGTGSAVPLLKQRFQARRVIGIDVSSASLEEARTAVTDSGCEFMLQAGYRPAQECDLVFTNGTFHHIPDAERPAALRFIRDSLKPGGIFALWENNPWNPGTRLVMSRIPFDRDAEPISPIKASKMLSIGGFQVVQKRFAFVFPRIFSIFRVLEPVLSSYPIGAQYVMICRKTHIQP